jgi:bifunctional DNase/RNase
MAKQETIINIFIYSRAEYIATTSCCTQVLWMKQTLTDIQVEYDEPIPIYCDNTSAINISKNPVMHSNMNRIPIKHHLLRKQVAENNIRVEYVGTQEQVRDIFTKSLPREAFEYLRQRIRVISTPK